jgi:hypothetical protein
LALEEERFGEFAFAADFEGAKVLVPQAVGSFWVGFAPEL